MGSTVKIICLALLVLPVLSSSDDMWIKWKAEHNKEYATIQEENLRKSIWMRNLQALQEINMVSQKTFQVALNVMADRNITEVVHGKNIIVPTDSVFEFGIMDKIPKSFDWRDRHVVTAVRNQGQCGNVNPIVATECVESLHAIKTGQLVSLSTQQVQDCCCQCRGCASCSCPHVFRCIHKLGGLCTEKSYPFTPTPRPCNTTCTPVAKIKGAQKIPSGNETALQMAVLHAPVMVGVDASHRSFQLYVGGIYNEPACSSERLDHMLQLVGYGSHNGQDYWICRNSWGTSWGMKGYILIARNQHNMCGIATMAVVPV